MNTLPLSAHLLPTRDLLVASLIGSATDTAPPAPRDLLTDLGRRFTPAAAKASEKVSQVSFFEKLRSMFASPAFGLAAIVMIAVVVFQTTSRSPERGASFRGAAASSTPAVTIVLLTSDPSYHEMLEKSGMFDMASVIETSDPSVAAEVPTPKLLLDFTSLKMVGYDSQSREIVADEVPEAREKLIDFILSSASALE